MFTSFGGTSASSRKRKNKEVVNGETTGEVPRNTPELSPLQVQLPQSDHPQSNNQLQISQVVSTDLTLRNPIDVINEEFLRRCFVPNSPPITQGQDGAAAAAADARLRHHIMEIQQLISAQTHHMQTALSNMWQSHYLETISAVEETMEKRVREKEVEIEKVKQVAEQWEAKARALEQTVSSLKVALRKTLADVCDDGGIVKEGEAESSYVDPRRVEGGPPQLPCNICRTKSATVLMWPCRHVTVCSKCEKLTSRCPLCCSPKDSCLDVFVA